MSINLRPPSPRGYSSWQEYGNALVEYLNRLNDPRAPVIPLLGTLPTKGSDGQLSYDPTNEFPAYFAGGWRFLSVPEIAFADLPSSGLVGMPVVFCTDGRQAGETAGNGTGCLAHWSGSAWLRFDGQTLEA